MNKIIFSLVFVFCFVSFSYSQDTIVNQPVSIDITSIGFGLGMDYGGIGGSILLYPHNNIGVFLGAGYALAGVGLNCGTKIRFVKENQISKFSPYLIGMYGYNAAVAVANSKIYDKLFHGPTFGLGFDLKPDPRSKSYFTFALLVPIRSADVNGYIDFLKNSENITFKNNLTPVTLSIGYRYIIN